MANEVYPEETKLQCLDLYKYGFSSLDINRMMSVPYRSVNRWANKAGISRKNGGSKEKFPDIKKKIINLYKSGSRLMPIAKKFGVGYGTAYSWIREAGISRGHEQPTGKDHFNWKNNATLRNAGIRATDEYKKWRLGILKRDNFTCCGCGEVGKNLNVHHILPFAVYPELRMSDKNGITLCKKCHRSLHCKNKQKVS